MTTSQSSMSPLQENSQFAMTRWSIVLAAGQWPEGSTAKRAMSELAQIYWFPLYAYLRRKGSSPADAQDLVQGFFTRMLEKDTLISADQTKGKFRSFLLGSLKNFHANVWDASHAQKRGGSQPLLSLDRIDAESRYAIEPVDDMTPERLYEKQWALTVLDQVLKQLQQDYLTRGQSAIFDALEHVLVGGEKPSHAQIATQLNMNESAVKVAAHRLRKRYRELLRQEIAHTVAQGGSVDEEIRELLNSL